MTSDDRVGTWAGAVTFRCGTFPIDWEALEDAFENNAPEVHSYLHLGTGEVLRVVDGIADPEMHARIASDATYLRIEPVSSREQYRWMERFIPMVEEPELRAKLSQAIDGKGAFRRFKDVLMGFRPSASAGSRSAASGCACSWRRGSPPTRCTPFLAPTFASRRVVAAREHRARARSAQRGRKGVDALRQQLREVVESLGAAISRR